METGENQSLECYRKIYSGNYTLLIFDSIITKMTCVLCIKVHNKYSFNQWRVQWVE